MPKFYARYSCVDSGKSLDAIKVIHNYKKDNRNVILIKPSIDTKNFGYIKSRACDTSYNCDYILFPKNEELPILYSNMIFINDDETFKKHLFNKIKNNNISCIITDETQFFDKEYIDVLYEVSKIIPVISYFLKTNYKRELFSGSKRILEVADIIEEIKNVCYKCNKKAIFSVKTINDKHIYTGVEIEISHNEIYKPVCKLHY